MNEELSGLIEKMINRIDVVIPYIEESEEILLVSKTLQELVNINKETTDLTAIMAALKSLNTKIDDLTIDLKYKDSELQIEIDNNETEINNNTGLSNLNKEYINQHIADYSNPHKVNKTQVGLSNVPNFTVSSEVDDPSADKFATALAVKIVWDRANLVGDGGDGLNKLLLEHLEDVNNPHRVTKTQIGLSEVPNYTITSSVTDSSENKFATAMAVKTVWDRANQVSSDTDAKLNAHLGNFNNPHKVTKAQVGLSKVDNFDSTSSVTDPSDSKFSTAKAVKQVWDKTITVESEVDKLTVDLNADITALTNDYNSHKSNYSNPHKVTKAQVSLSNVPNYSAVNSVSDASTTKFAVAASVKTAYDKGVSALNTANTKVNKAGDTITGDLILNGSGAQLFVAKQKDTTPSIDLAIGDADTGFNWNVDGVLDFYANSSVIMQVNTTQVIANKHLRAKEGVITDNAPFYSARSSNSDYIYHDDGDNTWHFCSDQSGTDAEYVTKTGNSSLQAGNFIGSGTGTIFHATAISTNANASFNAAYINLDCSGSQTTTADRAICGLFIDVDSSATGGDTNNEHRLYGIMTTVRATGDSDVIHGGNFVASADHTAGQVTQLIGAHGMADYDGRGGTGYEVMGAYLIGSISSTATTKASYIRGSWSRGVVDLSGGASTDKVIGSRNEAEINKGTVPEAIASECAIDINNDAKATNTYLIKAGYEGANTTNVPGSRYGVHVIGSLKNRIDGNIELGISGESGHRIELITQTNKSLQFKNSYGYINIGPYNSEFAHFVTDRAKFYFNKQLMVSGEIYLGSSYNQRGFHDGYHPNADRLTTARNIALAGDLTGSSNFDGSGNISITAVVKDDSHNHIIANVDGLQTQLDSKLGKTAKAVDADKIDGIDSGRIVYGTNSSAVSSTHDWNLVVKSGFYESSVGKNAPETTGWFWGLNSSHSSNGKYGLQLLTGQTPGKLYARYRNSDGTGTWQRLYTTSFKPTRTDVGLSNVNNWTATSSTTDSSNTKYATAGAVKATMDRAIAAGNSGDDLTNAFNSHKVDYNNPHKVTKAQVGLSSVNNWGATSSVSDSSNAKYATAGAVKTAHDRANAVGGETEAKLNVHVGNFNNPHKVTKAQVGLSNVPNYPAVNSVSDSSSAKFAVAASVKTTYDKATSALNTANTKVNKAGDTITGDLILNGSGAQLFVAKQLNSVPSIDLAIGDADTGFNWVSDGVLDFYANNEVQMQVNTSQTMINKYLRAKKGIITDGSPFYSARSSNSDFLYHNDGTNTWHFCSDQTGTDTEYLTKVGNSKLQASSFYGVSSGTVFHATATATNANASFNAAYIDLNCSGSQTTTADRAICGLFIDVDSSATGGNTNDEHRLYGIMTSVRATGDSDIIHGGNFVASADHTAGQVTQLIGAHCTADYDGRGGTGYEVMGSYSIGSISSTASTKATYVRGSWSKGVVDLSGRATTDKVIGSRNEVEVNKGIVPEAIASEHVIDVNNDAKVTNAYLIKAAYEGATTSNIPGVRYGLNIRGSLKNRIDGSVELGISTTSTHLMELIPQTNKTLQFKNSNGYVNIGPNNTSYAHFVTDRAKYHFNKQIAVAGEIYLGSSYNQRGFHDGYHPNADRLTTARAISLVGDLSGSTNFDGSSNINITAVVKDDSHNHIIANVDGLQTQLNTINSDITKLESSLISAVPAGTVIFFANSNAPTGYLKANGAAVSRSTYAALFKSIGTTYGSGNGSSTFHLPDVRGQFLRGWSDGSSVDSSRNLGSHQGDDFKSHTHTTTETLWYGYGTDGTSNTCAGRARAGQVILTNSGGSETRPINIALMGFIKY